MDRRRIRTVLKESTRYLFGVIAVVSMSCTAGAPRDPASITPRGRPVDPQHLTWMDYGGGPDQSKYVVLDEITKENVDELEIAWFYPTGDDDGYQFNPLIAHGVMYVLAKRNSLVALDAATGQEIWIHANLRGIARRGINYWESEDGSDRRLIFQINNYLQAIDARTGESILSFGENGLVDLKEGLDRAPETISRVQSATPGKIFENLLLLGSATGEGYLSTPGHLRAFDVLTGERVWTFRTIPHPGEYGYESWPRDAHQYVGGANTWGEISVDAERGIAYFPTGSPTYDYYGADRIGSNLFANSIIALDARTGERLWHYQVVHHDLWDYDLTPAPQLVTVRKDGEAIDAVAVATKHGFLFVFDRVSGEPVWPIEERPVPPSVVPGEEAWPTQPFPAVLPPFVRQSLTPDDVNSFLLTAQEQAEWRGRIAELVETRRTGLFNPPSHLAPTLSIPGAVGGANWGSTASNPDKGMVYIYGIEVPSFYDNLEVREDGPEAAPGPASPRQRGEVLYAESCQTCHAANGSGSGSAPSLADLGRRMDLQEVRALLASGRGEMPAFAYLSGEQVDDLYAYVASFGEPASGPGFGSSDEPEIPSGPVVASGGAPGGLEPRRVEGAGGRLGPPYPEGAEAPETRYYSQGYGLGLSWAIRPPWSTVTAYDLNEGTIAWQRPIGTDLQAAEAGWTGTGIPQSQRHGMVVTSTGVLFSTAGDGSIYAFDADTGDELWRGELPMGTEGIPAMYEIDGKHHLVVTATSPLRFGRGDDGDDDEDDSHESGERGYVVFSLPED